MKQDDFNEFVTKQYLKDSLEELLKRLYELMSPKPAFYTVKQFADLIGQSYTQVIAMCKKGLLKADQKDVNHQWRILASEVDRLTQSAEENLFYDANKAFNEANRRGVKTKPRHSR